LNRGGDIQNKVGGEWHEIDPVPVFVRRSSGRLEGSWFAIALDGQQSRYIVRSFVGELKAIPVSELCSLNKELQPGVPRASEQTSVSEKPQEIQGDIRDALGVLGLDPELHGAFLEKLDMVANVVATEFDNKKPDTGLSLLDTVEMLVGHELTPDDLAGFHIPGSPLNSAIIKESVDAAFEAIRPAFAAVLELEMFRGLVIAIRRSPAIARQMEYKLLEQMIVTAMRRRESSR
jgi:hypothetical protein